LIKHANARLTLHARRLLVERVAAGWPQAQVAEQLGVSRQTVSRWWRRYVDSGEAGLADRSSRPHRQPARTPIKVERRVLAARRRLRVGPVALAAATGCGPPPLDRSCAATGCRCCASWTWSPVPGSGPGPPTGVTSTPRPGDLIHVDVKKLGRIPAGGGWRAHGRSGAVRGRGLGYDYVHCAVEDRTRLAYSQVLPDERDATCAGFLHWALVWFRGHGVVVRRVLTDDAQVYRRGGTWAAVCSAWQVRRRFIKPGCPWTNGEGGTLPPHPAHRLGLPAAVHQHPRPHPRPAPLP
jgi:transposase-like protein